MILYDSYEQDICYKHHWYNTYRCVGGKVGIEKDDEVFHDSDIETCVGEPNFYIVNKKFKDEFFELVEQCDDKKLFLEMCKSDPEQLYKLVKDNKFDAWDIGIEKLEKKYNIK